jgi:hypothetical protein
MAEMNGAGMGFHVDAMSPWPHHKSEIERDGGLHHAPPNHQDGRSNLPFSGLYRPPCYASHDESSRVALTGGLVARPPVCLLALERDRAGDASITRSFPDGPGPVFRSDTADRRQLETPREPGISSFAPNPVQLIWCSATCCVRNA